MDIRCLTSYFIWVSSYIRRLLRMKIELLILPVCSEKNSEEKRSKTKNGTLGISIVHLKRGECQPKSTAHLEGNKDQTREWGSKSPKEAYI